MTVQTPRISCNGRKVITEILWIVTIVQGLFTLWQFAQLYPKSLKRRLFWTDGFKQKYELKTPHFFELHENEYSNLRSPLWCYPSSVLQKLIKSLTHWYDNLFKECCTWLPLSWNGQQRKGWAGRGTFFTSHGSKPGSNSAGCAGSVNSSLLFASYVLQYLCSFFSWSPDWWNSEGRCGDPLGCVWRWVHIHTKHALLQSTEDWKDLVHGHANQHQLYPQLATRASKISGEEEKNISATLVSVFWNTPSRNYYIFFCRGNYIQL